MKRTLSFAVLGLLAGRLLCQKTPVPPLGAALVVGINQYQDSTIAAPANARRDAEEYAALLLSHGIGLQREKILLLTDAQATLANFHAGLDWLLTETPDSLPRTVYFAGAAQPTEPATGGDVLLFFHDSPAAPLEGNTFSLKELAELLRVSFSGRQAPFTAVAAFSRPFQNAPAPEAHTDWAGEQKWGGTHCLRLCSGAADSLSGGQRAETQAFSNRMVSGLLGLADRDDNQTVTARELLRYLKNLPIASPTCADTRFVFCVSDKDLPLARVQAQVLADLTSRMDGLFPPIVHLESQTMEDALLRQTDRRARLFYEDFILSIKLKNYLPPGERTAELLYDSLLARPELRPIFGQCRRRFTAAMLDDTQQALNAYLNYSSQELANRSQNPARYGYFARLLGKASALMGERHFMRNSLEAKRLYFEGLEFRLRASTALADTGLLRQAAGRQLAALHFEPEAAYVSNELGVVFDRLGQRDEAKHFFKQATQQSPAWGIPHANLCLVFAEEKNWEAAIESGIKAVSCAPQNPEVYAILGGTLLQHGELEPAEKVLLRAHKIDPQLPNVQYNLACATARRGKTADSLAWLRQAHERGFRDSALMENDPDLAILRDGAEFAALFAEFYGKK